MIEKRISSYVVHKHDIEVNWNASSLVPEKGQFIVYDKEIDSEGNVSTLPEGRTEPYTYERFKIGDGIRTVKDLPFNNEIYIGDGDMPENATIQFILDGSDEEQVLLDALKEYINTQIETIPTPDVSGQIDVHNANMDAHAELIEQVYGFIEDNIPINTFQLTNNSGYITANDVPIQSVNGKTGTVTLTATDVGARPSTWTPTYSDVSADKSGTAESKVSAHNTNTGAHNDIRLLITDLTNRLNALANSTDTELDQMAELVSYIKDNRDLIDGVTTNKVNYTDIVNNLTTNEANKPLSAAQGVALKALIDAITIPTKLSQLTNDVGYMDKDDYTTKTLTVTYEDGTSATVDLVVKK